MNQKRSGSLTGMVAVATLVCILAATAASSVAPSDDWQVAADVAESCSCDVACPCNFGSSPTHDYCHGNRLYEITKGHFGETDITGLKFMVTFSMNEWAKLYVSDRASEAQVKALEGLVPHILGGFERWGIVSTQKVPLKVERSEGNIKFSVPESSVDMNVMNGFDGQPVQIHHLPSPTFQDYTQYKSVTTRHQSRQGRDQDFSHSGTTGFTSRMDVRSKNE